jgi:Spy/CpxP family protein refolding chaperone
MLKRTITSAFVAIAIATAAMAGSVQSSLAYGMHHHHHHHDDDYAYYGDYWWYHHHHHHHHGGVVIVL